MSTRHTEQLVRAATPEDVPDLIRLVRELAVYEKEPEAAQATPEDFAASLFPEERPPVAYAHVAEVDGAVVGMAIWFLSFSTWNGKPGIWLEDLFVSQEHRGSGLGKALLAALGAVCVERGYQRLEWWVLNWNEPSIGFYRSLGAVAQDEWTTFRMDGEALVALGSQGPGRAPDA